MVIIDMSDIYKVEALIVLADKASDDLSELLRLAERLGKIEICQPTPMEIKRYNALAKLLNLLRETARTTSITVRRNVTIAVAEPDR